MMHICISNLAIICSDNGLSPGRLQAISWTNAGILLIGPLGANVSEIWIQTVVCEMAAILSRPQCVKTSLYGFVITTHSGFNNSKKQAKLEQLECLRSEIPPAAPWFIGRTCRQPVYPR